MAEQNTSNTLLEQVVMEQILAAGGVSKKRRNLSSRSSDRNRRPQSKSPKRRANTPEPGRKSWTDESEKDASETEYSAIGDSQFWESRSPKISLLNRVEEKESKLKRNTAAERAFGVTQDPETVEEVEINRNFQKCNEFQVETRETKKITDDVGVEKLKSEDLQPHIVESTGLRNRKSHQDAIKLQNQGHTSKMILSKIRSNYGKLSTSEEEEETESSGKHEVKGKFCSKPKKITRNNPNSSPFKKEKIASLRGDVICASASERELHKEAFQKKEENYAKEGNNEEKTASATKAFCFFNKNRLSFFKQWFNGNQRLTDVKHENQKFECEWSEKVKREEKPGLDLEQKKWLLSSAFHQWKSFVNEHEKAYYGIMALKNCCIAQLLLVIIYCGFGAVVFRFTEGAFESFYKCGVKRVKRDFIDTLWSYSQYMQEEDWKTQARRKLMDFENQLHVAHEAGLTTYSGQKSWSFLNAVTYCLTVITTIGYGHISPSTTTGRAITIIYAIFGIPMFLILLADFGKLFTRGIKFVWAFVRRLYYTGSCKKVRKTVPMQEVLKGVQIVYDFAKSRRPSQWGAEDQPHEPQTQLRVPEGDGSNHPDSPGTPALSTFEINDEFNLPISVAITILVIYIFCGATIYWTWEEWSFFESFYFVFISMSTIGFGDFVPQHPMYMMASIIYLVFGLALTSMCINVVQEKLSDTFRQASTKIGATIGLRISEDGTLSAPAELSEVNPIQNVKCH